MESNAARLSAAQPFFSVIIPTFNSAKTIAAAVESVMQQGETYEIWVVDGQSSDATVKLLAAMGHLGLHWISEPDQGIYDAINKGLRRCKGRLIGVLGSDDSYAPGAFSHLRTTFERTRCDIVAGATRFIASDGGWTLRMDEAYGPGALVSGIPFGHNAMFATREAYDEVGDYDLRFRICADAHWVHRAIRRDQRCSTTPEVVVNFGMQGTSSTHAEAIMDESYRVICENFPGMRPAEAKALLFAVRKWGPADEVPAIVARLGHPLLLKALGASLPDLDLSPRHAAPVGGMARRLARWFHRRVR